MAIFSCFRPQFGRQKKNKLQGGERASAADQNLKCKVASHDSPRPSDAPEVAYEGGDEQENENSPMNMKRDSSACDLPARAGDGVEEVQSNPPHSSDTECTKQVVKSNANLAQTGHLSDPGTAKVVFCSSPKLQRSCSNLETTDMLKRMAHHLPTSKSQSFTELQRLEEGGMGRDWPLGIPASPGSAMTGYSADRVMLKKHSSSQVLPSRSRKLWWKMFLWSHRNLHKPYPHPHPLPLSLAIDPKTGYSSDTLEPLGIAQLGKLASYGSFAGKSRNEEDLWHRNQWVAFSTESSSRRVEEWVEDLEIPAQLQAGNGDDFPPTPETSGRSPARSPTRSIWRQANIPEEVLHANSIVRSLNSSSTVAHISGIGLKVIPAISCFSSLRSVNLSGNFIVRITPGSLPKGLHMLSLSRNKIANIEGLRELTRLRALDLSYNRITQIGHGLSNCTLIKELYLSGNKISDVEGLHRLLKLTVLDLSFNKITTMKSLGQLVANYNSLLALNLLGNPVQSNIGEDQQRKATIGLLPKLAYLNKQPIKQQRARDAVGDNVARAALGDGSRWSSRRKATNRARQSSPLGESHRSRSRSNSRSRHSHNPLKATSSRLSSMH